MKHTNKSKQINFCTRHYCWSTLCNDWSVSNSCNCIVWNMIIEDVNCVRQTHIKVPSFYNHWIDTTADDFFLQPDTNQLSNQQKSVDIIY